MRRFPHAVMGSFIRSFALLNDLAIKTETEVRTGSCASMSVNDRLLTGSERYSPQRDAVVVLV